MENKCDDNARKELESSALCGIMSEKKGPFGECKKKLVSLCISIFFVN